MTFKTFTSNIHFTTHLLQHFHFHTFTSTYSLQHIHFNTFTSTQHLLLIHSLQHIHFKTTIIYNTFTSIHSLQYSNFNTLTSTHCRNDPVPPELSVSMPIDLVLCSDSLYDDKMFPLFLSGLASVTTLNHTHILITYKVRTMAVFISSYVADVGLQL